MYNTNKETEKIHTEIKMKSVVVEIKNTIYEVNKRIDITEKPLGNWRTTLKKSAQN